MSRTLLSELATARLFLLLLSNMVKGKRIRTKGKIRFSEYFKKFNEGDKVGVVPEKGIKANFPNSIRGLTGTVEGYRGKYITVKLKDKNKMKTYIIHPVHLRKI